MTDRDARPISYRWAGHDEWMLASDGETGRHVLLVQPLFAELNRTRRLLRDVMRALQRHGIGSSLPDLPGLGESPRPLAGVTWSDWLGALAGAAAQVAEIAAVPHVASVRGGALLDHAVGAQSCWRLAPAAGAGLLRDLLRAQAIGGGAELGGYLLSPALAGPLEAAEPGLAAPLRTVQLGGSADRGDALLAGPALWRRSEPGHSAALAEAIAGDIAGWIARCGG